MELIRFSVQTMGKKARLYAELVMFRHTLFALPFAGIGLLLASNGIPRTWDVFWVMVAMLGARNGANALNRLVDKDIDRANPRTRGRHLPQGQVSEGEVLVLVLVCFLLFVVAAAMLNPICVILLPIPLTLFIVYSYTKRFTWLCHYILGAACGGAPVGAWMAVTGRIEFPALLLGAAATLWVAGFDIIYGTQDVEFDRGYGIHSIPARFGIPVALAISALSHAGTMFLLMVFGVWMDLGWLYWIGILITGLLFLLEHWLVTPKNMRNVQIASYNINEIIGPVLFLFTLLDQMLGWF